MESESYLTSARRCVLVMVFMISVALIRLRSGPQGRLWLFCG